MLMPLTHGAHSVSAITLDITSNTSNVNILSLATAAGYDASSDTTAIILNIASGVAITASGGPAIRTGALNAGSDLTINIASSATVCGEDGTQGSNGGINTAGGNGSDGTDAILFEISSGTGTYAVNNNGTHVGAGSGGGGGAGGGGSAGCQSFTQFDGKNYFCGGSTCGSNGSSGTAGTSGASCRAQDGTDGTSGSGGTYPGTGCPVTSGAGSGGAGGSGGTAGKAVNKGGLTVTTSGSGTYYGATS